MEEATVSGDDLLATRATAVGIGLLALMVTWLVANRVAGMIWGAPTGPVVALATAVMVGIVSTLLGYRRLFEGIA